MTNAAEEAFVYIAGREAGRLRRDTGFDLAFEYADGYDGVSLSVAMPVDRQSFAGPQVTHWFKGLLSGSDLVIDALASNAHCSPQDVFSLITQNGGDLPGAVQVFTHPREGAADKSGHYESISDEAIGCRLREIIQAERNGSAHCWSKPDECWSLSGNQGKISLHKGADGKWMRCLDGATSTYIVKPGVSWMKNQALVEAICMRATHHLGILTAKVDIEDFAGVQAIVIKRFDRADGPQGVIRLHQEDLCQALRKDPDRKYADEGGPTTADIAELLRKVCPEEDRWLFADYLLINHLLSATDGHCKNYSLIMTGDGPRLAPQYDLASNIPYMSKQRYQPYKTALSIGGESRIGRLRETSLRKCASQFRLDGDRLYERALELCDALPAAVDQATADFHSAEGVEAISKELVPKVSCLCSDVRANLIAPDYSNSRPRYYDYHDDSYSIGSYQGKGSHSEY